MYAPFPNIPLFPEVLNGPQLIPLLKQKLLFATVLFVPLSALAMNSGPLSRPFSALLLVKGPVERPSRGFERGTHPAPARGQANPPRTDEVVMKTPLGITETHFFQQPTPLAGPWIWSLGRILNGSERDLPGRSWRSRRGTDGWRPTWPRPLACRTGAERASARKLVGISFRGPKGDQILASY